MRTVLAAPCSLRSRERPSTGMAGGQYQEKLDWDTGQKETKSNSVPAESRPHISTKQRIHTRVN